MRPRLSEFTRDDRGQDLIEYTLLLAFVMFTALGLIWAMGGSIAGIVNTTNSNLAAANVVSTR